MLGDLVPTAGVAQGLALIVAPFMMLAWRGVGGVSLPPRVKPSDCPGSSLRFCLAAAWRLW